MYVRFPLSLRNVEDLLFECGIDLCHETVRLWWNRFGPLFAGDIRGVRNSRMRGFHHWRWHLDEMYVKLNGEMVYLWRAVDHEGEVLESYVTRTRDKGAALAFMKKALKRHGSPDAITTDGLRSYGAAMDGTRLPRPSGDRPLTMKTIPTGLGPIAYDDQGDAAQPVALLWPSLFSDHRMWEAQIGSLRAAGWRTIAIDPPGHGDSSGPGRLFTLDECTEVALTLIDTLPANAPVVMLGTSWGGMIAPRVAHARPGRLAGLVMTNTTAEEPDLKTKLTAKLLTVMLRIPAIDTMVDDMLLSMQMSERTRTDHPEIARTYAARFRSYRRKPFIQAVDSVLVRRDAFLDKLHKVTTPALVLSGAYDTILPTAKNRRIADRMPNAEGIEIEGAAHLVPVERPEQTNALMLDRMNRWIEGKR